MARKTPGLLPGYNMIYPFGASLTDFTTFALENGTWSSGRVSAVWANNGLKPHSNQKQRETTEVVTKNQTNRDETSWKRIVNLLPFALCGRWEKAKPRQECSPQSFGHFIRFSFVVKWRDKKQLPRRHSLESHARPNPPAAAPKAPPPPCRPHHAPSNTPLFELRCYQFMGGPVNPHKHKLVQGIHSRAANRQLPIAFHMPTRNLAKMQRPNTAVDPKTSKKVNK